MQLHLSSRLLNGVLVLDCSGRLVWGEEALFFHNFSRSHLAGTKAVVLNLTDLSYIDSGGLNSLIGAHASARLRHGHVKFVGLAPRIRDLLRVTKLLGVLEVYDTVEDAVEDFRQTVIA